jgi:hypothetical protein
MNEINIFELVFCTFSTDFNFIQDSLIDCQAPIPAPTAAVPVAVPPVSLASMDSAVVMVHAQVPHGHLPHGHPMAYSFLPGDLAVQ